MCARKSWYSEGVSSFCRSIVRRATYGESPLDTSSGHLSVILSSSETTSWIPALRHELVLEVEVEV